MLYVISHWAFGPSRLLEKVTDEAREKILAPMMAGEASMCFGLSASPAPAPMRRRCATRAVPDGNGWRLTGRKIWTSNSPVADYCIVFAITDPERAAARKGGISAFLVPTSSPGFEVQRIIKLFGHIGGDEAELRLEDVRVEPWQLVGELHEGFAAALYGVSLGRIYNSARAVGYGRWAIEKALDYAQQRNAFGKAIAEYQGVTFPLADSAMEIHAAHLMGLNVGDAARPGRAGGQGARHGQGLRRAGRRQGGRPRHADLRRHGLHQRAGPAPCLAHAAHHQRRRRHQRDPQPLDRPAPAERRHRTVTSRCHRAERSVVEGPVHSGGGPMKRSLHFASLRSGRRRFCTSVVRHLVHEI